MVHVDMDTTDAPAAPVLRTKDFAALQDTGPTGSGWYITSVRVSRMIGMSMSATGPHKPELPEPGRVRFGTEDVPDMWLSRGPAQGLLEQFWSPERRRFEAADEDEAYALLIHVQKTYSEKALN